ncbi:MAG TPA: YciI-like protein [Candidatus Angelobacter sp.]|nr:YciI-like protein [Candidatus Angelobacter sp.]
MHYVLLYEVRDDYVEKRGQFRELHLKHARAAYDRGELILGGALADPIDGAMLIFRGPTADAAEAFAKVDPYVTNGLVTTWRVRKWSTVIGDGATVG